MYKGSEKKIFFRQSFEAFVASFIIDYLKRDDEDNFCGFLKRVYEECSKIFAFNGTADDKADYFIKIFDYYLRKDNRDKLKFHVSNAITRAVEISESRYLETVNKKPYGVNNRHSYDMCSVVSMV